MKDENPAAFPVATEHHVHARGMSLRDWFAGQALAGICANPNFFGSIFQQSPEAASDFAGKAADAVLAHRQKGQTDERD